MHSVLAFGDSLTWGARPDAAARHAFEDRWPNVLAAGLEGVEVISEGLRGRTTCFEQPTYASQMSGAAMLPTLLDSHAPLDTVVVMLGSNDIYFGRGPEQAALGLERLVEQIRHHPLRMDGVVVPGIMLIAPPQMVTSDQGDVTEEMIAQSRSYPALVETVAEASGCAFFNAGAVAKASPLDGIHLDADNTRAIGAALVAPMREILRAWAR